MATSGSIDFNLTAREIVQYALDELRVTGAGEEPTAEDAESAQRVLNALLKSWQKHENLWRYTEGSVTLVADDIDYALSPVPFRVISARYRNSGGIDLPMSLLTREEYYNLPIKTNTGTPIQYYIDYQRAAATMYVWQALSSITTETIKYTFIRKFEDIDSLDNDLDVRQEHLEMVALNLAVRLAPRFGKTSIDLTLARAEQLLNDFLDDDREDEIRFVPDRR